jgi:CubicO group peptidase (beta-lactamase class C family)
MNLGSVSRVVLATFLLLGAAPGVLVVSAQGMAPAYEYWPTQGWPMGAPESFAMDPEMLSWADGRLWNEAPLISSVVVVRRGHIVFERNHPNYDPTQPLHTWSVSKSVTSIAVGLALEEGYLTSLDQTLGELIPYRIPANADPRVWNVTVEQLLTMTAGWTWDGRINFARFVETDDLDLMLSRPLQCDPGACFEYDSGSSNLLSFIVQERTGQFMADFLHPRLFEPLGIAQPYWLITEDGANRGGGGLHLTPRDMAKIGYLYLNNGRWDDRQIVSPEWVAQSTTTHASGYCYFSGANIGTGSYGYHWWMAEKSGPSSFAALGYGGQVVYVVPEKDLVVVTAFAGADPNAPELQQRVLPVIEEVIVPAAYSDSALSPGLPTAA